MAIAAALTLNHATDLFANTLVMHCLSLMHSRGNNVIYDAFAIKKKRKEDRVRKDALLVNKMRVRNKSFSYEFPITALKHSPT